MITRRIPTPYRHLYRPDGSRRQCHGRLEILCEEVGVYVRCNYCGEGYRFEFVLPGAAAASQTRKVPGAEDES